MERESVIRGTRCSPLVVFRYWEERTYFSHYRFRMLTSKILQICRQRLKEVGPLQIVSDCYTAVQTVSVDRLSFVHYCVE